MSPIPDAGATHRIAAQLARVIPTLGVLITEPLPEVLRDSRSQLVLLQLLSRHQAATVSEVAQKMGIAVPTASAIVRKMVEKGLLERNRDQADWRSVRIALSIAGWELFRAMTARRTLALEDLLSELPEDELAALSSATAILSGLVQAAPPDAKEAPP